jgi:UDP-2,3-diacylglucosamine pyrophosphatase LpxH
MGHANQYNRGWSKEEIQWLKTEYPYLTKDEVVAWGKKHGRTYRAIINQASALGIKKEDKLKFNDSKLQRKIQEASQIEPVNRFFSLGRRRLVKIVVAGDNHYPFNNPQAEADFFKFIASEKPEFFVHCGDLLDFHEISCFRRVPQVPYSLKEEIEMGKEFFERIRNLLPKITIFYVEGNHEFRWRKYLIDYAFVFYDFISLKLTELLNLKKLKVNYIPLKLQASKFSHNFIQIDGFYIGHFDKSLQNAGYSARWLRDAFSANIITGHTHRLGLSYKTYLTETKIGAEVGCLCSLEPAYLSNPDWQNGWAMIIKEGDKFNCFLYDT